MDNLSKKAIAARDNDKVFEELVGENTNSLLALSYQVTHNYITTSDDEWSVVLEAYHEAVRSYNETKGSFGPFSALVVRRRLNDHFRSRARFGQEIPTDPAVFSGENLEEDGYTALEAEVARDLADSARTDDETGWQSAAEEIADVTKILEGYGFSFRDLTTCSPKSQKTRESCAQAVTFILEHSESLRVMREKKKLPIRDIAKEMGVQKKVLERHRKYIIAAVEILAGQYPVMAEYLAFIRKAKDA